MAITICQILSGTTSSLYYTKKNHQWKTSDRSHRKFYKIVWFVLKKILPTICENKSG